MNGRNNGNRGGGNNGNAGFRMAGRKVSHNRLKANYPFVLDST